MNVCILGSPKEPTAAYVGWLARQRGCSLLELPEADLGVGWDYDCDDEGAGTLRVGRRRIPWEDVDGVFARLEPVPPASPLATDDTRQARFARERREGLHQLLERIPCTVVNRPSAERLRASRACQLAELAAAGLAVPRWIATNSPAAVRDFDGGCGGRAAWRALSDRHSRLSIVDETLLGRLEAGSSPILVFEHPAGLDVRVHTVGRTAFAGERPSEGRNRRLRGSTRAWVSVPRPLAHRCSDLAASLGLVLAGFDFRVTAEGRWLCLEIDPAPAFLPDETSSGLPIGSAVLDALTASWHGAARAEELPGLCAAV